MNEFDLTGYYLFWDAEKSIYQLKDGDEIIGELPSDTSFANNVLDAFNQRMSYRKLKSRLSGLKLDLEEVLNGLKRSF